MAKDDWAIIVGVTHYPGFTGLADLRGSESDAKEFWEWVIASDGGDIPKAKVVKICSSQFKRKKKQDQKE